MSRLLCLQVHDEPPARQPSQLVRCCTMAKPGSDRDGAMVDKQAGKKVRLKSLGNFSAMREHANWFLGVFFFLVNSGWAGKVGMK